MFTFFRQLWYMLWDRPNIQTFTYYIPAPPPRPNGYREKEFDQLFYNFINQGYHIISVNTESHHSNEQSGMWVIFTVKSYSRESKELDLNDDFLYSDALNESNNQVEGLCQLDDEH
jgi:hypothetical protein